MKENRKLFSPACILMYVLLATVALLSGCATYGEGIKKSMESVQRGDYQDAKSLLKKNLDPEGDDRLLYHLELGTIEYLEGQYEQSVDHFNTAEVIAEDLYTTRADEVLSSMLLNPRQSDYAGQAFEKVYINYYKALNFLNLFEDAHKEEKKKDYLEKARVEVRRLDFKLHSREIEQGSYQELQDKKQKLFVKILDLFKKLQGQWVDEDWLVFREDAYARYFSGVLYEMNGEYDDARISYQKSAKLYEQGYREQYGLDQKMQEQAWFDTIRMMRTTGGWGGEWPRLAKEKLSEQKRDRLKPYSEKDAQIVIIQHLGRVPQREELNLRLSAHPEKKSLVLAPILIGSKQKNRDQLSWFFLLYADKGVLDIVKNYALGELYGVAKGFVSKTIYLGPAWDLAQSINLPQTLGRTGIRVTIPYYRPLRSKWGDSRVLLDGQKGFSLLRADSVAELALQNQLLTAGRDLRIALARAALKNILAAEGGKALGKQTVGSELGAKIFQILGKGIASASSAAETRNWLLLPREIRVLRLPVSAGRHSVTLNSYKDSGVLHRTTTRSFVLDPGEIKVWVHRSL